MSVLHSARRAGPPSPAATVTGWTPALALIGTALAIFAVGFHRDAANAVRVWIGSTAYNHCFLVLPVVGYLIWQRRSVIRAAAPQPTPWPLVLMPFLSAAWLIAAALDVNEGRQLLVVAMFELVLLAALGLSLCRALLAPLLFLFFLVPSGGFLVPGLQSITTAIAVAGLRLLHIPVYADGYQIDIPQGGFTVAEACAGLRFLIAASVFSCLFAVVMYRHWWRRSVYIALAIATAVAANALRVFGLIAFAHYWGSAKAIEADHILYGWFFFSLVILLLIGIGLLLAGNDRPPLPPPPGPSGRAPSWRHAAAAPLAALIAVAAPGCTAWRDSLVPAFPLATVMSPKVAPPWHEAPDRAATWRPVTHGADRTFLETFAAPDGAAVTRYIALYRLHPTRSQLTSTENRIADGREWQVVRQGRAELFVAGQRVGVNSTEIAGGARRRLVWSFFVVDGEIASGLLAAKLQQFRAVWRRRAPVGAFVAVAASSDDGDRLAARQLAWFLAASQSLPDYVAALSRQPGKAAGWQWRTAATAP
jgi:exosortase A